MRKWGEMHPALRAVLVGVVAGVAILAVGLSVGSSPDDAIANAVFYALMIGGGLFFLTTRFPTAAAKLDGHGQLVIFLRFPDSPPGSLNSLWQMGTANPHVGSIDFQPIVDDDAIPSGRSKALTGLAVTDLQIRKANRQDNKQDVPWDFRIITLASAKGVIEIAASPAGVQKIQQAVASTST